MKKAGYRSLWLHLTWPSRYYYCLTTANTAGCALGGGESSFLVLLLNKDHPPFFGGGHAFHPPKDTLLLTILGLRPPLALRLRPPPFSLERERPRVFAFIEPFLSLCLTMRDAC